MLQNIKLELSYDGTNYQGFQKNKLRPSIEEELEKALFIILQQKVKLQAASRTDKGVHALQQVVNFLTEQKLNLDKLKFSLNSLLPKDIVILKASIVPLHFHPTLSVKSKKYCYDLCYHSFQLPKKRLYAWHFPYPLDIEAMQKAATFLLGTHCFASFTNKKNLNFYKTYERTIHKLEIKKISSYDLRISITGIYFLYNMVRIIVGTLAYVGAYKIHYQDIPMILQAKKRNLAGITAPAHGLTLSQITYPKKALKI